MSRPVTTLFMLVSVEAVLDLFAVNGHEATSISQLTDAVSVLHR